MNTEQRELLLRGLDAVARERERLPFATEVLVLDNCSQDGSLEAARLHPTVDRVIERKQRFGKAENDSLLLQTAAGEFGLLLNEDSELLPGATFALHQALEQHPMAACAGSMLLRPDHRHQPSAWRFPTLTTALLQACFLHRFGVVQSRGNVVRRVDWAQSAALLVRRTAAEQVGWLDPAFFVYGDEVDFCKRLADAGWDTLYVPAAQAIHHEQLSTAAVPERRIIEFSRNRDLYLRKHHDRFTAISVRLLTAWAYALRALAATLLPGHSAKRYWFHVTATLRPNQSEGIREAAHQFNAHHEAGAENL